jgi:hypothetical protein
MVGLNLAQEQLREDEGERLWWSMGQTCLLWKEVAGGVFCCWLMGGQQPLVSGSTHCTYYLNLRSLLSRLKVWASKT